MKLLGLKNSTDVHVEDCKYTVTDPESGILKSLDQGCV